MKRFIVGLALLCSFISAGAVAAPAVVHASVPIESALTNLAAATCSKPKLLGIFVSWYQYLDIGIDNATKDCAVKNFQILPGNGGASDVPLILLAVVDDLIRVSGLLAVGFVIFGGIRYATSQGNPDEVAKAQSTVVNALIGLSLAVIAVGFVSFIGRQFN